MDGKLKVTFEPSGRKVFVLPGTILLEAAARAGFVVETPCGGTGKCGKCVVRVTGGCCSVTPEVESALSAEQIGDGYRLACSCKVTEDLTVEIPETSLFQTAQKILSKTAEGDFEIKPSVRKQFVALTPPDQNDAEPDAERLKQALGPVHMDLTTIRALPRVLRESDFRLTATIIDDTVVAVDPGDSSSRCYGMCFDIGTTTLVGTLVDMQSGHDLAVASMINPQTSFGDDVLSRIKKCREEADGLEQLQSTILDAVNRLVGKAAEKAGIEKHDIRKAVFAGNTTMQQILCGVDPSPLGELPFAPAFRSALRTSAAELGLDVWDKAATLIFPQIGGFVGGDTVAGIIATRIDEMSEPALLIDVGTNGEIVLANNGKLIATSVAAGPAFEGARITHGMRATSGAIEKVVMDDDIRTNVIGDASPAGLCGTGLIDATAAMLRAGILEMTGAIVDPAELPDTVPPAVRQRVIEHEGRFALALANADESATGEPLCLYQRDIRELQLANGAIRAGISILLKMEGLQPDDLGAVFLAGAFGNFIRRSNALRIGMFPQVASDKIRFVGNTASFGAKRVLLSSDERERANGAATDAEHVDLSLSPDFQLEFSEAMLFPG